jgi:hypothetical protein
MKGSVQNCPHCGEYMDVGADDKPGEWADAGEEGEAT